MPIATLILAGVRAAVPKAPVAFASLLYKTQKLQGGWVDVNYAGPKYFSLPE